MPSTPRTRIKICCMASVDEARMAVAAGADAVGLVSAMPSGPGPIEEALIATIAATVPPPVATFLLTSLQRADAIVAQQRRCRANTLQLVDAVPHDELRRLRDALPGVALVQVVHVQDASSIDEAADVAPLVDAILLDSGRPALAIKELGGTGRTHDWTLSARIRERIGVPLFLAGGLTAANVGEAIRAVRPFGVDVCSRIRSDGRLDAAKLSAFVAAVATA
jgi:phosphoribosylanthranilate isomerase